MGQAGVGFWEWVADRVKSAFSCLWHRAVVTGAVTGVFLTCLWPSSENCSHVLRAESGNGHAQSLC
jgi:hypothetical protein